MGATCCSSPFEKFEGVFGIHFLLRSVIVEVMAIDRFRCVRMAVCWLCPLITVLVTG